VKEKEEKIKRKLTGRRILRIGVNSFIYLVLGILLILIIGFSFTQTSVFRDWLKDAIVEELNSSMNGEIAIRKLEGTIFTSLILKNTLITQNDDTILSAEHIEIKTSPLKLLFKIIYLRKFEVRNAAIYLKEDSSGTLNVARLFPPTEKEVEDTSKTEFPFSFQVADLYLDNISFTLQEYSSLNSTADYESINMSDLRIDDLKLQLSAFADINNFTFQLGISEFSFSPNFKFFNLRSLSGDFFATQSGILVNNLNIVTEESEISINAGITQINFFEEFSEEELGAAPLRVQIQSDRLSFDDVSTFVSGLTKINGKVSIDLSANGSLYDFAIDKLALAFYNTSLNIKGSLKNTINSDDFFIDADLSGSTIDPSDPAKLFPSEGLPDYPGLGILNFDTLTFKGSPVDFGTSIFLKTSNGSQISGFANLNFKETDAVYDIDLETRNLDIFPFAALKTNLNSRIRFKGKGFSPAEMNSNIQLSAQRSTIGDAYLKDLNLVTTAENGKIQSTIEISLDSSTTLSINSGFDFTEPDDPSYTLDMTAKNFDIGKIISDEGLQSKFNFDLQGEGKGFDPDSLDLFVVMNLHDSFIYDFVIDSTALIIDIRRNDDGKKIINVISDLADLTISGQYSISTISDVISAEIELLQSSFIDKYSFLFPLENQSEIVLSEKSKLLLELEDISLDYLVDFKDFLTIKFNSSEIEIDGSITGQILALEDSIVLSSTLEINYFKYWNNVDLFFLTKTRLDFNIWNKIKDGTLEDFSSYMFFRSNRLYAGSNFYNIGLRTEIENDSINISFNSRIEDYIDFKLKGSIDVDDKLQSLIAVFDSVQINYNDLEITNAEKILVSYKDSEIGFDNFKLALAQGIISVDGKFGTIGAGTLNIASSDLQWREIGREILGIDDATNFDSQINIHGLVKGNLSDPRISMNINLNDLTYQGKNIGTILSDLSYENDELKTDIKFIDSLRTIESPKLMIYGTIPFAFTGNEDESSTRNQLELKIISEEFDLSSLGNAVPSLNELTGLLNINLDLQGGLDNPELTGTLSLSNTSFTAEVNNLRYNLETNVLFSRNEIFIQNISVSNIIGTKYGGTIKGNGEVLLDKLSITSAYLKVNGDLKILDRISREVNPLVYGDLAIQTDGDIHLTVGKNSTFIDIPINVTVADLNFQLLQSAYQNTSGFIYKFVEFGDTLDYRESSLDSLILISEQRKVQQMAESGQTSSFDYRVKVNMKTEAKMIVVLSKELNQDLVAVMDGSFELTSREGRTSSTGQLNMLEGSKLSFIKSFDVTGNVRVEKLDNPTLNIVATYRDYYYPIDTLGISEEIEVAVKIRFNGPLSELAQNFIRDEQNIAVYVGAENIENDQRDPTKNTSDAFMFILAGKFTDGATSQEINAAANTAANLAGSVLGGVLNKYFGDYVRNVQLRQVGAETKFNLMGRVGAFRYDIGGSTDVFQDLSRANIKIEYPIIPRLLIRLERKEAINETTLSNDMFNELGLKYKIDF
jgi:hypothetical protein